jgi:hypothetical protein
MTRLLALNILLFLLPFAVYAGWILIARRRAVTGSDWPARIVLSLSLIGGFIMLTGLVLLTAFSEVSTGDEPYRPPALRDGQIIPGRFGDD